MPFNIGGQTLTSAMLGADGQILNKTFTPVSANMIDSLVVSGCSIISQGDDANGLYTATLQHDVPGCGGPSAGFWVKIKNTIPWTRVLCTFSCTGTASCWSFNNTGYVDIAPGDGNLLNYNPSQGDIMYRSDAVNSFNFTNFTVQAAACDNDSTNFMHYSFQAGDPKVFTMLSRRNSTGNIAGPNHGRSCNSTGGGSRTTISNIYIF